MDERAGYWRIRSVNPGNKTANEWFGMTWLEVQQHLDLWRRNKFTLVPQDEREPHFRYTMELGRWYMAVVTITQDTEYIPDLVGKFFGGKSGFGD